MLSRNYLQLKTIYRDWVELSDNRPRSKVAKEFKIVFLVGEIYPLRPITANFEAKVYNKGRDWLSKVCVGGWGGVGSHEAKSTVMMAIQHQHVVREPGILHTCA